DYVGSFLLTLTIVPMLLAFSWAGTKYAWSSVVIIGLFLITIAAFVLFLLVERKVQTPVLPLGLFKSSVVSISNIISFLMNVGMMGALTYMPFYVQGVMGISPTYAGYITMPMSIGMFTMSAYAGRYMTKIGKYKNLALIGMTVMVIGMSLMIFMKTVPVAVLSMIIFGSGLGLGMPVFMMAVQNAVDSKDLGVATASVQLFRNLGGTIGVAVMGTVLSANLAIKLDSLISSSGDLASSGLDQGMFSRLTQLLNPQLLLDHSKLSAVQDSLPASAQPVFAHLSELLKQALAGSLSNVFLTGTIVLTLAFVLTFFLKELPLRTTVHKGDTSSKEKHQEPSTELITQHN
ncbi:MAG: transporter, partial [Neobacillus sp.]|nr:transporter [Neobacillus sp.]